MHRLRMWLSSALIAGALTALSLWRAGDGASARWWVVLLLWAAGVVVLHLLLHNRWMRRLEAASRTAVTTRRGALPHGWRPVRPRHPRRPRRSAHPTRAGVRRRGRDGSRR